MKYCSIKAPISSVCHYETCLPVLLCTSVYVQHQYGRNCKEKAKTWFQRAEVIPTSLVLFIEESISSSFRSIRDCAEIAAWAAAEAASEPTMADKNATWKTLQLLSFLPQLSIFKVNNNTVQGSLWNMPATSMNTGGSVTHLCSVPPKSGITF